MILFQALNNKKIEDADVVIFPLPFEKTVCGKLGTKFAPKEIIKHSMDIEYYEEELQWSPFNYIKIHTVQNFGFINNFKELKKQVKKFIKQKINSQLLISLGGEHSITPFITYYLLPKKSTVIVFDAHADFRISYLNSKNNHACSVRNINKQNHNIVLIGVRSFFENEEKELKKNNIKYFTDHKLQKSKIKKRLIKLLQNLSGNIYISIDMDVFTPALVPGVGTPLPGGIEWYFFNKLLKNIIMNKNINLIGIDIVELIPEDSKVSQITAAKIIQKIVSYWGYSTGFYKKEMLNQKN